MKIGIVSIGNDSLELFRFLHRYDHEYVVYYDADAWPLGDKTRTRQLEIVQQGYDRLVAEGCDHILLPPVGEIGKVGKNSEIGGIGYIVPLYQAYVMSAFEKSLIGKIGYLAESGQYMRMKKDEEGGRRMKKDEVYNMMQEGLQQWVIEHQRTEAQTNTKQFHRPFAWRGRDVRQRKYFLRSLSPRDYLINKVVKFDLRKLKDADVDTVLPTERSHFAMEKTIERFFRSRRTKRHGMQVLEQCFVDLCHSGLDQESLQLGKDPASGAGGQYSVSILSRGDVDMLESVQKYSRLMSRGKAVYIVKKSLD